MFLRDLGWLRAWLNLDGLRLEEKLTAELKEEAQAAVGEGKVKPHRKCQIL
jgi:hypothetical protein